MNGLPVRCASVFAWFIASCRGLLSPASLMNIVPYFQKNFSAGFCVCAEFRDHKFLNAPSFLKKLLIIYYFLRAVHDITAYSKPGIMAGSIDAYIDMPEVFFSQNIQIALPSGSLRKSAVKDLFFSFLWIILCGTSLDNCPPGLIQHTGIMLHIPVGRGFCRIPQSFFRGQKLKGNLLIA